MTQAQGTQRISRRTLLKSLGAAGAVGALGVAGLEVLEERPASRFDLTVPSSPLHGVQRTVLHEAHRVSQSFAFDNVNRRVFVAQLQDRTDGNDLCISQLDLHGTLVGYMHVPDAGHGVSIGVEPVGDVSYLWTEAVSSLPASKGRGTALQRFAFRSGQEPTQAQTYLTGSENVTCATDPTSQRLLVRRHIDGDAEFTVHDLAAARDGDFSRPSMPGIRPRTDGTFQGYAFFGDYLYVLTGSGHDDPADIDSALSSFDLRTGKVIQDHVPETVSSELPLREPEGMAVYRTGNGRHRLCFGLASTQDNVRFANFFYKDVLVR